MDIILRGYEVNHATWFYLSFILIIAVFFRFNRIWSMRNFDLILLLILSPGLLIVRERPNMGYAWLFCATGLILVRLFFDGWMPRRPRLDPNLNVPGLGFLCACSFAFLMTEAFTVPLPESTMETVRKADQLLKLEDGDRYDISDNSGEHHISAGPASQLLTAPLVPPSKVVAGSRPRVVHQGVVPQNTNYELIAARSMAVLSHVAVILGLIALAHVHFGDAPTGLAMATLYLLLPCTAYDVGKVIYVLPAALIVWALVAVRRPMYSGTLLGLACGTLFFPIFLLPLWVAYYGRKGGVRFISAWGIVTALLIGSLALTSVDSTSLLRKSIGYVDWSALRFQEVDNEGFWTRFDDAYRMPVFVTFVLMLIGLTIWPRQKSMEHLISHSTAIVVATQFWYPVQGGVYLLWYIPLLLIVVFRPKLSQSKTNSTEDQDSGITKTIWAMPHARQATKKRNAVFP